MSYSFNECELKWELTVASLLLSVCYFFFSIDHNLNSKYICDWGEEGGGEEGENVVIN